MSSEARQEILDMLANGKITAAEAADLLEKTGAITPPDPEEKSIKELKAEEDSIVIFEDPATFKSEEVDIVNGSNEKPRWLRIRVRDLDSDRNRVTVNVPLWLVSAGFRAARYFDADIGGIDTELMAQMIQEGERGVLVDVIDEDEHVQIFLD